MVETSDNKVKPQKSMKIIAYTSSFKDGMVLIEESSGESKLSDKPESLFNFLLESFYDEDKKDQIIIKVVWNLDEFAAPILRVLGEAVCRELAEKSEVQLGEYHLFYIPGKVFAIRYKSEEVRRTAQIYSIEQYYQDMADAPANAYEVKWRGDALVQTLKSMGMEPRALTSPARILTDCVMSQVDMPSVFMNEGRVKRESIDYALKCCSRLWIANYKVGHWNEEEIWDYDLTSAFPGEAIELWDTRPDYCRYKKSEKVPDSADWGFLHGVVTVKDGVCSPIMRRDVQGERYTCPVGSWEDTITLDEFRFIEEFGLVRKNEWLITGCKRMITGI